MTEPEALLVLILAFGPECRVVEAPPGMRGLVLALAEVLALTEQAGGRRACG